MDSHFLLTISPSVKTEVTTTTTKVHYAPVKIPRNGHGPGVAHSNSAPSEERTSRTETTYETRKRETGPSTYPLKDTPWPFSVRDLTLAMNELQATFVDADDVPPEEVPPQQEPTAYTLLERTEFVEAPLSTPAPIEMETSLPSPGLPPRKRARMDSNEHGWAAPGPTPGAAVARLLSVVDVLDSFDTFSAELQSYVLFKLLQRSSTPVMQRLSPLLSSALRRDFLVDLPPELALLILSYLDVRSLCRAACVSRRWRGLVDTEWRVWRRALVSDRLWRGDGSDAREARLLVSDPLRPAQTEFCTFWNAGVWARNSPDNALYTRLLTEMRAQSIEGDGWTTSLYGASRRGSELANSLPVGTEPPRSTSNGTFVFSGPANAQASPVSADAMTIDSPQDPSRSLARNALTSPDSTPPVIATGAQNASLPPAPPPSVPSHPYKWLYRKRAQLAHNWKHATPRRLVFPAPTEDVVTCLQFDSEKIVAASDDKDINIFSTRTGLPLKTLHGHEGGVWALQYAGNTLVSGSTDRTVRVWDLDRGVCTHVFVGHSSTIRCLQIVEPVNVGTATAPVWEPPQPLVVTGSRDWTLRVWRLPLAGTDAPYAPQISTEMLDADEFDCTDNPYFERLLTGHQHAVRSLAAHGNILVSGSYDTTVRVWNLATGACVHHLEGHTQRVYSVVYDPVRAQCASGSMDNTVRVWDTRTGTCLHVLEGHTSLVGLLELSARVIVSAAADATLRIWDADTGVCRSELKKHTGAITCFQHDGSRVVSGSDGTLALWDVESGAYVRTLADNLTAVWQVSFNERFCVAAIQRSGQSEFEVLDFGVDGELCPEPSAEFNGKEDEWSDLDWSDHRGDDVDEFSASERAASSYRGRRHSESSRRPSHRVQRTEQALELSSDPSSDVIVEHMADRESQRQEASEQELVRQASRTVVEGSSHEPRNSDMSFIPSLPGDFPTGSTSDTESSVETFQTPVNTAASFQNSANVFLNGPNAPSSTPRTLRTVPSLRNIGVPPGASPR